MCFSECKSLYSWSMVLPGFTRRKSQRSSFPVELGYIYIHLHSRHQYNRCSTGMDSFFFMSSSRYVPPACVIRWRPLDFYLAVKMVLVRKYRKRAMSVTSDVAMLLSIWLCCSYQCDVCFSDFAKVVSGRRVADMLLNAAVNDLWFIKVPGRPPTWLSLWSSISIWWFWWWLELFIVILV